MDVADCGSEFNFYIWPGLSAYSASHKHWEKCWVYKDAWNILCWRRLWSDEKDIPLFCNFLVTCSCSMVGMSIWYCESTLHLNESHTPSPWPARPLSTWLLPARSTPLLPPLPLLTAIQAALAILPVENPLLQTQAETVHCLCTFLSPCTSSSKQCRW